MVTSLSAMDRYGTIFEDDELTILVKCKSTITKYMIPKQTVQIKKGNELENAFGSHCKNLETVYFEENCQLEVIGDFSFYQSTIKYIDFRNCTRLKIISESAFLECTQLSSVKFSNNIEYIGKNCYKYTKISNIDLPINLKELNYMAFCNCKNLVSLTIPPESKLTTIVSEAAFGSNITSIYIPKSVTSLENGFIYCPIMKIEIDPENPKYYALNNVVYTRDNSSIIMAAQFAGDVVLLSSTKSVGRNAIRGCELISLKLNEGLERIEYWALASTNITELCVPKTLSFIDFNAFSGSSIVKIDFNCSITSISFRLFYNCKNLISLVIPNTVTAISSEAFGLCSSLNYLYIPASVQNINGGIFSGMNMSCEIVIESGAGAKIESMGLYSGDGLSLKSFIGPKGVDFTIIDGTVSIESNALKSSEFKSITIPKSVRYVNDYSFEETKIGSIVDISSVISLSKYSFQSSNISQIILGSKLSKIDNFSFANCKNLKRIQIPSSVKTLGSECFSGCTKLDRIDFGDYYSLKEAPGEILLESIGQLAFQKTALRTIEFPKSLRSLGYKSLSNSTITSISFHSESCMTELGQFAIADCIHLTSFSFPKRLKSINQSCFTGDINLESITLSDYIEVICSQAFSGCVKLEAVIIGDYSELKTIEGLAFEGCVAMKKFEISKENTNFVFDNVALYNGDQSHIILYLAASPDKSFTLPSTILEIGAYSFYGAVNLENVTILEGCSTIGVEAFRGCSNLKHLVIPSTIYDIAAGVFTDCPLLKCSSIEYPPEFNYDLLRESGLLSEAYEKCATIKFTNHNPDFDLSFALCSLQALLNSYNYE